jgi:mannose-1-phosphate guanylyltransferase
MSGCGPPCSQAGAEHASDHWWLIHGDERPKQYAALIGSRSMLRHTLDRVALRIPPERTVVVVSRVDAPYIGAEFAGTRRPHVLVQPSDRGTAAGVLLPAHWISWRVPNATVAVFPSDHFVLGEAALMSHMTALSRERPAWMVLLGAAPSEPDPGYGWIETGGRLGGSWVHPIWRVQRFCEKPSPEAAAAFFVAGYVWNTLIFVARVTDLLDAGSSCLPDLSDRLAGIGAVTGTECEARAIQQAYARTAPADFSRAILEPCASTLSVSRLPATVSWSGWGTPERVLRTLRRAHISPAWLRGLAEAAATAPRYGASAPASG